MIRGMRGAAAACVLSFIGIAACADGLPTQVAEDSTPETSALIGIPCVASVSEMRVECGAIVLPRTNVGGLASVEGKRIIGGQNQYVTLANTDPDYDAGTEVFSFDVTVQNLLNETLGAFADGVVTDPEGIRVFFQSEPVSLDGPGVIEILNEDGTAFFTRADQPFYRYTDVLGKDQVSSAKTWQFGIPSGVDDFSFTVYVHAAITQELVINEVMVNPPGTAGEELPAEWVEIYNAGTFPVDLQNLVIADSAASGRRPYHLIASSVVVAPGGYAVLGGNTNTTTNLGAPVDYAWAGVNLANSLDAFKIALVVGMDTLTIDRTQYANAAVSAQPSISRELKNPALDNSNMDGSNWDNASVTSVYGPGGRGTPKAQNSTFTPVMLASPAGLRARSPERIGSEPPSLYAGVDARRR